MNTVTIPVVGARPGTTVQVVPGQRYVPLPADAWEPWGLAEMVPAGGGTLRPMVRICPRSFGCTTKNLRRLGIGISTNSMVRLIEAGFVASQKTTPGLYQFDYHSFRDHEARVAQDSEFWTTIEPGQKLSNGARIKAVSDGRSFAE